MLKNRQELQNLRAETKARMDAEQKRIIICAGAGCVSKGALKIYDKFAQIMKDKGIIKHLRKLGAVDGDTIRISDFDFEFFDDQEDKMLNATLTGKILTDNDNQKAPHIECGA